MLFLREKKLLVKTLIFLLFITTGSGPTDPNECGSDWNPDPHSDLQFRILNSLAAIECFCSCFNYNNVHTGIALAGEDQNIDDCNIAVEEEGIVNEDDIEESADNTAEVGIMLQLWLQRLGRSACCQETNQTKDVR